MTWTRWRLWLENLVRRSRFEDDLAEEIEFHLEARAADLEAGGLPPDEARRQACLEFGSLEKAKAEVRDVRLGSWVEHVVLDLRHGRRMLRKHPGFTAVAVLSLALGIAANAVIFSIVNAFLLRSAPVDRPEELIDIYQHTPIWRFSGMPYADYEELNDGTSEVFSAMAAYVGAPLPVTGAEGVEVVWAEAVSGDYFRILGVEAALGRTLGPEDDVARGAHPVVVLGHGYWQSRFGGDPDVLGHTLRLGGRVYTIIGVAAQDYRGFNNVVDTVLYAPLLMLDDLTGGELLESRQHLLFAKARLAPGVTLAKAEAAVAAVDAEIAAARPEGWEPGTAFAPMPSTEVLYYPAIDPLLRTGAVVLMAAVGLVLFLACMNLASFLLARGWDRRREVAVRMALGASRGTLVRQLLTETLLLGLLAGVAGVVLANATLRLLMAMDLPLGVPMKLNLDPDSGVLLFTLAVAVVAGTLLGLVPAWRTTRPDLAATLQSETAGGGQRGALRWRHALVVTQLSVSLILLVGAGLFLRNWQHLQAVDPGFGRESAALLSISVPTARFSPEESRRYVGRLAERFRTVPGVDAVGIVDAMPLTGFGRDSLAFRVDGHVPPDGEEAFQAHRLTVGHDFFDALGIAIVHGRAFRESDGADGPPVAVVSAALARRFWPDGDAVGRILRRSGAEVLIVGVARDIKVLTPREEPASVVYLPYDQDPQPFVTYVARTPGGHAAQVMPALLLAGREIDADLWVHETKTLARHFTIMRWPAQATAFLLAGFGVLALALSVIGLYGVVRYAVASRTREVGIRMALGAEASDVIHLLTASGLRLVFLGGGLGLVLAYLVARSLDQLLFGVESFDPFVFITATLVLASVALAAAWLPAYRAGRVDPVTALHTD